jgi:transposase InsO family protein
MTIRRTIVEIDPSTVNVTAFCRDHGVSTWFFYDLRLRYAEEGEAALVPKARVANEIVNRCPADIEDEIVAKRKELDNDGLDSGAATIAFHLRDLEGLPSNATIWRVLKRRGFVVDDPSKAPKTKGRSFSSERANDCWQIDDTTWPLPNGREVKIINIIDDCSRTLMASVAVTTCTGTAAFNAFATAAAEWGWPARFLSDNAKAFRHVLADALAALGIAAGHSRPYHPQTCGKVERFHQTLKKRLATRRQRSLAALQAELDAFRQIYNHERPHDSLGKQFPANVWSSTPKSGPAGHPLTAKTRIHTTVVSNGQAWAGPKLTITIGAAYDTLTATTVVTGTTADVFVDGNHVRHLTINPNRRTQPLYDRPGRPTRQP